MIKKYIKREAYLSKLRPYIGKHVIKVIVGQRRVGKSYLLFQLMDEMFKTGTHKSEILYINKELFEFDEIRSYRDLIKYVEKEEIKNKKRVLMIDEIQDIEHFEKALRHFNATEKYDIYCTGSNANLLSGELATYLSGRYVEIEVFSLSYGEFLRFHKLENTNNALNLYIKYGGLPYLVNLELNDEIVYDYLRNIYNTILLKDVVARFGIRNVAFLERLVEYLADNLGSLVSAKKISDYLKSQKIKISPNVVLNYLSYLEASFFIFKALRADVRGKKIFETSEKYYFEDLGLRHALVRYAQTDINKVLENLVYMQLKFLGYDVKVGKLLDKEVDFMAEKNGKKVYVQTTYLIADEKTRDREFGNLLLIKDNYPKMVVSMDEGAGGNYKGIKHMHIREFLTKFE